MRLDSSAEITRLLQAWGSGDESALERLTPLVYDELRRIAHQHTRKERGPNLLQTTAIVHEAWLRLVNTTNANWADRAHFFAVSSKIMRRILVDLARARLAAKRGRQADWEEHSAPIDLDAIPATEPAASLIALDDALTDLARFDLRKAQVIELRFFGGLSVEETASTLGISPQSVMRDCKLARAWLARELSRQAS
jgi:RNA polymerase sigma factor (TIGR02999 family)